MRSSNDRMLTDQEKREAEQGRFVGRAFLVPVVFGLLIMAGWVMLATLITPGAYLEGPYGADQRLQRSVLIAFGMLVDGMGLAVVWWRLTHWSLLDRM